MVQALDIAGEAGICREYGFSLPDKPSIAVLPFDNISNDPNQEIFVDGLTEDLVTDLSKISGLFVIARNSTFIYKGKPVEIRTVAETLGVRYVLEGSVRREGDRLRVNAQLIDAMTGGHIWADRFDGEVTNIFDVQDEFVLKIVKALAVELTESEKSEMGLGNTDNIEAREAFREGGSFFQNSMHTTMRRQRATFRKLSSLILSLVARMRRSLSSTTGDTDSVGSGKWAEVGIALEGWQLTH